MDTLHINGKEIGEIVSGFSEDQLQKFRDSVEQQQEELFDDLFENKKYRKLKKYGFTMTGILQNALSMSSIYNQAKTIFESDGKYGPRFLDLLESLIASVALPEHTVSDRKNDNNFVNAYNQISSQIVDLIKSYHEFKNQLPAEQVEQLSEAGVNSAITGEGLSNSVLDMGDSPTPQGLLNTTPEETANAVFAGLDSMMSFAGSFFNIFSGASALPKALEAMDLANDATSQGIDITGEEAKNRQELHDLVMLDRGFDPREDSKFSRLEYGPSSETMKDNAVIALGAKNSTLKVSKAYSDAALQAVNFEYEINKKKKSGTQVIEELSRFNILGQYFDAMCNAVANETYSHFVEASTALESLGQMSENNFNIGYFDSLNGVASGKFDLNKKMNESIASGYLPSISRMQASLLRAQRFISQLQAGKQYAAYRQTQSWIQSALSDPSYTPFVNFAIQGISLQDSFNFGNKIFGMPYYEFDKYVDYGSKLFEAATSMFRGYKQ